MMSKSYKIMVEIPFNSEIKYEYNRKTGQIEVDRILRDGYKYPATYGFLPEALDWDGDELDVLVYSERAFVPGVMLNVRVVGALRMIDSGETDTKLIAVHEDDFATDHIKSINDIPQKWLDSVKYFFEHYKDWKGKNQTHVPGFENELWAQEEINECIHLMKTYGKMDKEEFVKKMMKEHPEKYII
ncbi:inorganic diphosphatase [Mycoplasma phocimorsus]|uniref:inorganic diphosphatase n=2 Tax=Mycoplasma phocimorsus TaxID=3045839 RepID=UPI0032209B72